MRSTILVAILLLPLLPYAQSGVGLNTFHRVVGADYGSARAITEEVNGKYAIAAQWEIFNPSKFGTQIITNDFLGNAQWGITYRSTGFNSLALPNDIVATTDGGFAVVGETAGGTSEDSCWVFKVDLNGDLQWALSWGSPITGSLGTTALEIEEDQNGDLVVGGEVDILDNALHQDIFLTKISSLGVVQWNKHISSTTTGDFLRMGDLQILSDGGMYLSAQSTTDGITLSHLDEYGQLQWSKAYGSIGLDTRAMKPHEIPNGIRFPVREAFPGSAASLFSLDTDNDGNALGGHSYRITGLDTKIEAVTVLENGSMAATGGYGANSTGAVVCVLRTDPSGVGVDAHSYGTSDGEERALAITKVSQGNNLVFAGSGELQPLQQIQGGTAVQTYIIQTDATGFSGGCEDTLTLVTDTLNFMSVDHTFNSNDVGGWAGTTFIQEDEYTEFNVCSELAVVEQQGLDFELFPNPTSEHITLRTFNNRVEYVTLYNLNGQEVLTADLRAGKRTIDLSHLEQGLYIMELSGLEGLRAYDKVLKR